MEDARFLGWLTRDRQIELGKRITSACGTVRDESIHCVPHVQRSIGTACADLVTAQSRPDRLNTLQFLLDYDHV